MRKLMLLGLAALAAMSTVGASTARATAPAPSATATVICTNDGPLIRVTVQTDGLYVGGG